MKKRNVALTAVILILLLGSLFCSLIVAIPSAPTNHYYIEGFEDDVDGASPTASWYTYSEFDTDDNCEVTDFGVEHSGTLMFSFDNDHPGTGAFSQFTFSSARNISYCEFWFRPSGNNNGTRITLLDPGNAVFELDIYEHSLWANNGGAMGSLSYPITDNVWYRFRATLNFTTDKYHLFINSTDKGWKSFFAPMSYVDRFVIDAGTTDMLSHRAHISIDDMNLTGAYSSLTNFGPVNNATSVPYPGTIWCRPYNPTNLSMNVSILTFANPLGLGSTEPPEYFNVTGVYNGANVTGAPTQCSAVGYGYYWMVKIVTSEGTTWAPASASGAWDVTGIDEMDNYNNYAYWFSLDFIPYPLVTFNYPTTTVTAADWKSKQYVNFTMTSPGGYPMGYSVRVEDRWGNEMTDGLIDHQTGLSNGSYQTSLTDLIPFTGENYTIEIYTEDNATRCGFGIGGVNSTVFHIGNLTNKKNPFSIKDCAPADEEDHGVSALTDGFTFDFALNCTSGSYPMFWCFLTDENQKVLAQGSRSGTTEFMSFTFGKGLFQTRHQYKVYIGGFYDGSAPGTTMMFTFSNMQLDNIYDITAVTIGSFSYEFQNFYAPKIHGIIELPAGHTLNGLDGDADFYGYRISFATYPAGETVPTRDGPSGGDTDTGSTWGRDNIGQLETNTGISGLMIIAGLIVVALFAIMPYLIIKKKGSSVPLPVFAMFGLFGAVLSFSMGLFPLWFFILPTFLLILIIVYKVSGWILSSKELVTVEGKK